MVAVGEISNSEHFHGLATILAIGTATLSQLLQPSRLSRFLLRHHPQQSHDPPQTKIHAHLYTSSSLLFSSVSFTYETPSFDICFSGEKSTIRKRYMHLSEELLKQNPNMCTYKAPSLDARQDIMAAEGPKLGKEAAVKAIEEWGQPKYNITHLVFCASSGVDMPGADYQLTKLLGLRSSVNRVMIYLQQGCFAGGTGLRLAKDFAENNKGARVLVVYSEISVVVNEWNSIFWAVHQGGWAILDEVEIKLGLKKEKLETTRRVLSEYGNVISESVLFILEEMRNKSLREGKATTGEGLGWGIVLGLGPGITVETVVLHRVPVHAYR